MNLTIDDDFFIDDDGYVVIVNPCDSNQDIRLQPATEDDEAIYEQKCDITNEARLVARKERTLGCIKDLVTELMYYQRKEDECDLCVGAIEDLLKRGDLTIDEMVQTFQDELTSRESIRAIIGPPFGLGKAPRRL